MINDINLVQHIVFFDWVITSDVSCVSDVDVLYYTQSSWCDVPRGELILVLDVVRPVVLSFQSQLTTVEISDLD